jgi:pyruvate dehydrogenase E2 component (dihydrolipoamide acetyltransferase)
MALEFKLPDIGEGIAEGEIVKWLVKVGDVVKEHQSIVEVMTDKATVEVPAPAGGTITEIRAKEGDTVPVGSVIFVLDTAGGSAPAAKAPAAAAPSAAPRAPASSTAAAAKPASAPAPAKPISTSAPARGPSSTPASTPAHAAAAPTGGATIEFKLPDIGEGIAEGEIVKWLVKAGDVVQEHQSIVEVMTDKATVEVPAPASGTITRLLAKEGEVVPVGSVIFSLATAGAAAPIAKPAHAAPAAAPNAAPAQTKPAHAPAAREPALAGAGVGKSPHAPSRSTLDDKVLAVPSARRLAREMEVDLSSVSGSGRNGIVRRADVEAFANARGAAPAAATATTAARAPSAAGTPATPISIQPGERETRTPFRGVRRKIAEAMVRSKFTAPHFTVVEEVDVTDLVSLREKAKTLGAESDVKVTFMPFIMKATALALAKYPELNGHLDEAAQELVHYQYVNLGIAMDTPNGLIVPVVKEVQAKGILQIASELNELAERTRAGKVKPEELKGSTFSITNAGNIGGTFATPIINFPDIAILGVHRIMKKPGVVETPQGDKIEVRQYMNFSCSVDHRLADGASGARFLVYLKRLLESPGLLAL